MLDIVTGIATVPAILALVNLFKSIGLSGRWSAIVAVVLGVVLSLMQWAWADYGWFTAGSSGLLMGLAAAGLYDLSGGRPADAGALAPDHAEE